MKKSGGGRVIPARCAYCGKNALKRKRTEAYNDTAYLITERWYVCANCGKGFVYQETFGYETQLNYLPRKDAEPESPSTAKKRDEARAASGRM